MTAEIAIYDLPPVMKLEDCQELENFLQQSIETPVTLNCKEVTRFTGLAAQMLACATAAWTEKGLPFHFVDATPGCIESLETLGLEDVIAENGAMA